MHSPYFPPTVPPSDAALPSTRSGRVPWPRFTGTIKALRLPAVPPAALRCLRLAVPRGAAGASLPLTQTQVQWTWGSSGAAVRPPRGEPRRLLQWDFRSSIAWLLGSLSTLRRVSCLTTVRKTRFQVLVGLSWAGVTTRRVSLKGFRVVSYISSSLPELNPWRNPQFPLAGP